MTGSVLNTGSKSVTAYLFDLYWLSTFELSDFLVQLFSPFPERQAIKVSTSCLETGS